MDILITFSSIDFQFRPKIRHQITAYVIPNDSEDFSLSSAGANLGVLALQISVTGPKFVIICATRAGANLGVLAFKISVLRQKLVIICPTRAGANLGVLAFKIKVLRQKLVIICATLAGVNLRVL